MKRYLAIYLIILGTLCLQSCEKETMVYQGEPGGVAGIYFLYSGTYTIVGGMRVDHYKDSIEFSFAKVATNISESTVNLPVVVLGDLAGHDRTFKVRVTGGNAVEGVDYEPLKDEYVVPANKAKAVVPFVVRRTDKLKKGKVRVILELVENENFKLLLDSKLNDDGKTEVNTLQLKVIFSEIYTEPWDYSLFGVDYFGKFTVAKFEFINTIMQWSPSNWDDGVVKPQIFSYTARRVQSELQTRADNNDPVYDEDGTFMQLVSPYTVDYSKYETE